MISEEGTFFKRLLSLFILLRAAKQRHWSKNCCAGNCKIHTPSTLKYNKDRELQHYRLIVENANTKKISVENLLYREIAVM